MCFTMKYAHHSEYKTAFTKKVEATGRIHALIPKGEPWKNGFIERSNRTDNDNLFHKIRFVDSEERKYQLKLWEMEYNNHRPHQGINNLTPLQKAQKQHPIWVKYAMGIT
jgi:transposase InsO family protein